MATPMMTRHSFPLLRLALSGLVALVLAFGAALYFAFFRPALSGKERDLRAEQKQGDAVFVALEDNLRRTLLLYDGGLDFLWLRPQSTIIALMCVGALFVPLLRGRA